MRSLFPHRSMLKVVFWGYSYFLKISQVYSRDFNFENKVRLSLAKICFEEMLYFINVVLYTRSLYPHAFMLNVLFWGHSDFGKFHRFRLAGIYFFLFKTNISRKICGKQQFFRYKLQKIDEENNLPREKTCDFFQKSECPQKITFTIDVWG